MKRLLLLFALLITALASSAQQPLNVWVKVSPVISASGIVSGATNLPDGTIVHVILGAVVPSGDFNKDGCLDGDGSATVAVSHGSFGPIDVGTGGMPCLKAGTHYVVDVVMQAPFMQPATVIAIVGKNGENITGPLVSGTGIGRDVQAKFPVEVR
jgi:hypothetical protein